MSRDSTKHIELKNSGSHWDKNPTWTVLMTPTVNGNGTELHSKSFVIVKTQASVSLFYCTHRGHFLKKKKKYIFKRKKLSSSLLRCRKISLAITPARLSTLIRSHYSQFLGFNLHCCIYYACMCVSLYMGMCVCRFQNFQFDL